MQVGWYIGCARAADQQVPTVLHIERFQIRVIASLVGIVFELLLGSALIIILCSVDVQFQSAEKRLIISDMPIAQLLVSIIHQMPCIINSILNIRCSLFHGMFIEAIKTGFVDKVDDGL